MNHKEHAKNVFEIEAEAIANLSNLLTDDFNGAVDSILNTKGRTIICGMGKSGIIGKKIAATLASTGTPSFFMHPGEAFHGDLGMVTPDDVFLAISNSGETEEVLKLLPFLRDNGNILISLTGNPRSTLAEFGHYHLNICVPKEACPLQLAPTSSTTATLAMGDALSVALMEARSFKPENFARFHPGGTLGRKLLHNVKDEMVKNSLPTISINADMKSIISSITVGQLGLAVVTNDSMIVVGIITDGDLRRALEQNSDNVFSLYAKDIMTENPVTIDMNELMANAFDKMEKYGLNRLVVLENNLLVGILKK
ncbi:MAG: KpsF/GutQ family sugar-phosphate isomerase [Saccharospirillaceae bacterium]|nr:KpsF/GutQ family sugar-phosphate isomerase [Saccharospirillaceae bacterium]